jgi:hypothetical protein
MEREIKEIPEDEIEVSTSIEPEKKRRRLFRMLSLNRVIIECSSSRFINSNITTIYIARTLLLAVQESSLFYLSLLIPLDDETWIYLHVRLLEKERCQC